jgi:hypothetical protein
MTWLLTAYFLGLIYLAVNRERLGRTDSFRMAWIWFALIPISHFVFALFRVGNLRSPGDLALIEIWSDGIAWLLLGISMLYLAGSVAPERERNIAVSHQPPPIPPAG